MFLKISRLASAKRSILEHSVKEWMRQTPPHPAQIEENQAIDKEVRGGTEPRDGITQKQGAISFHRTL
ncbi:MAG: hypothetical protein IKN32_10675 [Bacteroidales bacterium]|nr:hypothetical protein [Bacteroidales bacterium]